MTKAGAGSMVMVACPECDAEVLFQNEPSLNERVHCPRCKAALQVNHLAPVRLDWAFIEPLRDPLQETGFAFEHKWHKEV